MHRLLWISSTILPSWGAVGPVDPKGGSPQRSALCDETVRRAWKDLNLRHTAPETDSAYGMLYRQGFFKPLMGQSSELFHR
jgi:hypothetical protein